MAAKPIFKVLDDLPAKSMTTRVLGALDWVVPGQYKNIVGFENSIKTITGETDQDFIQQIGERAIALYNDKTQGYQRALWLYQSVDNIQAFAGYTAMAGKIGENVGFMSFLSKITPKPDTTQALDLTVKLIVELVAFCQLNGLPGDSVGDFVKSLSDYRDESLMRMAALICLDGMIPLGPDFVSKVMSLMQKSGVGALEKNERFQKVKEMIPGKTAAEQLSFMEKGMSSVQDWMKSFISARNLGVDKIVGGLKNYMDGIEGKLDYVAAFLDMTTNYYEHTGTQSVARSLIMRAVSEV